MLSMDHTPSPDTHGTGTASRWVQRWSHLVPEGVTVLDVACGQGRHMKWFSERGHAVTGLDRSLEAIQAASKYGTAVSADIENAPWPLMQGNEAQQFGAVVVTNYLWRPLLPIIADSVAPGGLLIYETFTQGNETVGKPSRPDFLLRPTELLQAFRHLQTVAFEEGFLDHPPRFIQRIAAIQPVSIAATEALPRRYSL